ncbi:MAG: DUF4837 family protein [Bacteroidaceae bacterium]
MRKVIYRSTWSTLLFILVLASCDSKPKPVVKPHSKGLPSELLLVTDEAVGKSDIMDSLNAMTQEPVPEIMQPEPMFHVLRVSERNYTQRYVTMHTKLFVRLNADVPNPMMGISRDASAFPQTEVTVSARNLNDLRIFLARHKQDVIQALLEGQLLVRMADLRKQNNAHVYRQACKHMGYSILVPKSVHAVKKGKRFLWAGSNQQERDMNVVIYEFPWNGRELDDTGYLVSVRDSVMKCNIPGENEGQWMQTSQVDGNPLVISQRKRFCGREYVEMRGMWDVRNAPIGGPFVAMFTLDSIRGMVLATEGFVYSPSTEKRDLIRLVEASLLTIKKRK